MRRIFGIFLVLVFSSCSNLRYLEDGQYLYTGSGIRFETEEKIEELNKVEAELERVIRPLPNQRFLLWRPRLWLYNVAGEPTGRGLRHLMRNRFGRPPVLFSLADAERNQRLMENRLFNMGYFDASVNFAVQQKERTVRVDYVVGLRRPYLFGTVYDIQFDRQMSETHSGTLQNDQTTSPAGAPGDTIVAPQTTSPAGAPGDTIVAPQTTSPAGAPGDTIAVPQIASPAVASSDTIAVPQTTFPAVAPGDTIAVPQTTSPAGAPGDTIVAPQTTFPAVAPGDTIAVPQTASPAGAAGDTIAVPQTASPAGAPGDTLLKASPDTLLGAQQALLSDGNGVLQAMDADSLYIHINALLAETTIKEGTPYRLSQLRAERIRIDRRLKRQGYFYFHPDHILFLADTTNGMRRADIHPTIKTDIPLQARHIYRIGDIFVEADYLLHSQAETGRSDGIGIREGITLFDAEEQFKPSLISRAIFLQPGSIYNIEDHDMSIRHLTGLGVFRFINMRFLPRVEGDLHYLDVNVMLSPAQKKRLSAELRGVSKSNNFAGPGLRASFSNINLLGGAEQFDLGLTASYEALVSRQLDPASAWELGVEAGLALPGFLALPSRFISSAPQFVPKTNISLGVNFLRRTDAFGLTSVRTQYGYEWNQSLTTRHRWSPVVFNLFILGEVSEQLDRVLATGALLRRGLFEQFILGSEYSWFYNTQLKDQEQRLNDYYVNINIDVAGNLLHTASSLAGRERDSEGVYQLFGQGFAQYVKTDIDLRYYRRLAGQQRVATRLVAGAGLPYSNSETLPYLKLFSAGGSNGIRAFHPRTLGPGTYAPPDSLAGRFNIYQSGEIKLEMSAEYRFGITQMFKGALFADAGNVWRLQDHEEIPGGQFQWDSFYRQIALGAGAGLRLDATFFILRLDMAFPLSVPSREREGFFEPIKPLSRNWRRDNLVFNLAIGYPF